MAEDFEDDNVDDGTDAAPQDDRSETAPAAADATGPGDGLPGFPVDGYPEWRAGVFSAPNLLGLVRVSDLVTAPAGGASSGRGGIDWDFIHKREGADSPDVSMSVPTDRQRQVLGHSGPTIGYGFDVGQHSVDDLRRLGLSQPIIDALTPYTQMQGSAAQAYVQAHPLTLARPDVDAIDQAVQNKMSSELAAKFDPASQVGPFASLPANTQTAIADLYHQYGASDPARATPNFWRQITGGDWQGAYDNLQDFHDLYRTRRKGEADLLKRDIDAGILPTSTER